MLTLQLPVRRAKTLYSPSLSIIIISLIPEQNNDIVCENRLLISTLSITPRSLSDFLFHNLLKSPNQEHSRSNTNIHYNSIQSSIISISILRISRSMVPTIPIDCWTQSYLLYYCSRSCFRFCSSSNGQSTTPTSTSLANCRESRSGDSVARIFGPNALSS